MTNDGTLKVTPITAAQPQAVAKFTITATLDGFPFTVEAEGKADGLRALVARLKAIGAEPRKVAHSGLLSEPTKSAPLCPTHNTAMAPSTKRIGTYYCKSPVGQAEDGRTLYCTKKA